jgi:small subunit ribosomal protein S6
MPLYETVFIARQDLAAEDIDTLTDNLAKIVTTGGGKVVSREYWGARNLAYKVKKNTRGHYVFLSLDSEYGAIAELNRVMGFNEDIIRSVTFSVEEHQGETPLCIAKNARDHKAGKVYIKKEPSKIDLAIEQVQFDI